MEKRIKDMVEAMDGKKKDKKKKYVDPEEYKEMTGIDPEEDEEDDDEEPKRKGKIFGKGLSIIIAMNAKKSKNEE